MKNFRQQLALLLVFMFMFTQAVPLGTLAADSYSDPNNTMQGNSAPSFANNSTQSVLGTADSLGNYYLNQYKNSMGWDWLKTTNVNFTAFSGNTPQWNINTFQPLTLKDNLDRFLFAQGQYGTGNNTINLGVGYRTMNNVHSSMYGVNLFYDWQTTVQGENGYNPSGSHMRLGAGVEYFTGSIEARVNGYYGVSSDVQVGAVNASTGISAWQTVSPGLDLSVGTDFSFWNAPWLKLTATGSWYQQQNGGTINGYNGSPLYANITAALQVTPQLSITGGGSFGNGNPSNGNIGVQFNLLAPPQPALFLADPVINNGAAKDISYKMLQPVQRNNTITVERYTKQSGTSTSSVLYTVKDSEGNPVQGASVEYNQSAKTSATASAATSEIVTDASGNATLTNINLSQPVNVTATLGAATFTATVPANQTTATGAFSVYGNVAMELGSAIPSTTSGALIIIYGQDGSEIAQINPNATGNRSGNTIYLRGMPAGEALTAVYQSPDGAVINISSSVQASSSPALSSATVATISDSVISNISEANSSGNSGARITVTYSDGVTPLSGVTVILTQENVTGGASFSQTTGANGTAMFNIPASLKDSTFAASFSDSTIASVSGISLPYNKTFTSGQTAPATGTITIGEITYSDGTVLANGSTLTLSGPNGSSFTARTASYNSGKSIVFERIPYGTYTLSAVSAGGSDAEAVTTTPELTVSEDTPDITATGVINSSEPVTGNINVAFTANGNQVSSGMITAIQDLSAISSATFTAFSGESQKYTGLTPGDWYFVMATAAVGDWEIDGYYARKVTITKGTNADVTVDGEYNEFYLMTQDADTHNPIGQVSVSVTPSAAATVTTNDDGYVVMKLWRSSPDASSTTGFTGKYTLAPTRASASSYTGTVTVDTASSTSDVALDLTAKSVPTEYTVSGTVASAGTAGGPVSGATVTLQKNGGTAITATTDDTGAYTLSVPSTATGTYTLTVSSDDYNSYSTTVSVTKDVTIDAISLDPRTLAKIEVVLGSSSIKVGDTTKAIVNACYSNNYVEDVTSTSTWSTNPEDIVTITAGDEATVQGVAAGTATIFASYGGQKGSADIEVTDSSSYQLSLTNNSSASINVALLDPQTMEVKWSQNSIASGVSVYSVNFNPDGYIVATNKNHAYTVVASQAATVTVSVPTASCAVMVFNNKTSKSLWENRTSVTVAANAETDVACTTGTTNVIKTGSSSADWIVMAVKCSSTSGGETVRYDIG